MTLKMISIIYIDIDHKNNFIFHWTNNMSQECDVSTSVAITQGVQNREKKVELIVTKQRHMVTQI